MLHYVSFPLDGYNVRIIYPKNSTTILKERIMNKNLLFCFLSLLLSAGCASPGAKPSSMLMLYDQKPAFYAYVVGDVDTSDIDMHQNELAFITPASCQKTITALLAYTTLGNDYRYPTTLSMTPSSDAVLTFSGDPSLTSDDLAQLLFPLQETPITGRLILDASYFQTPPISPNLMIDDVGTYYSQPISAMNIDENLLTVTITWDSKHDAPVAQNDMNYPMSLDLAVTSHPTNLRFTWIDNCIHVTGNLNQTEPLIETRISPADIDLYMIKKIKTLIATLKLQNEIIVLHDHAQVPTEQTLLHTAESAPLSVMLPPALKRSDNLVFDSLYLTILHHYSPTKIQHWEEGDAMIKALLKTHFDVSMDQALIIDGSGGSRYNRIQAKQLYELLRKGYAVKEFVDALPSPGENDSTLATRTQLPKTLKAKTGSMSGMSCLCGYHLNDTKSKAFVIVANSFSPPLSEMYSVQDRFLQYYLAN